MNKNISQSAPAAKLTKKCKILLILSILREKSYQAPKKSS